MDIQQNQEAFDKLRLENGELKKELEKERLLHKMLYKEWENLKEQISGRENDFYESKPRNIFYKYAFYVLLIAAIPFFYFQYFHPGKEKAPSSSEAVSVPAGSGDSITTPASVINSAAGKDSPLPMKEKQAPEKYNVQQPIIKSEEKKTMQRDSNKREIVIKHKPEIEAPITDDIRDSISSEGFNAYFTHSRNPFKKSSQRYKIWAEGWNEGKAEAKKVLAKDSAQK